MLALDFLLLGKCFEPILLLFEQASKGSFLLLLEAGHQSRKSLAVQNLSWQLVGEY